MNDDERHGAYGSRRQLRVERAIHGGWRRPLLPAVLLIIACLSGGCDNGATPAVPASDAVDSNTTSPLLQKWCSECHAPPRPDVHTAREWPSVVAQMQQHRITQGLGKIDDRDLQDLLDYLQNHARPPSAS